MISETGLRKPQHALESCILQPPFIVLFPEIERIPITAEPAPFLESQDEGNCLLEQVMNTAIE